MRKKVIIAAGLIIIVAVTSMIGIRLYKNRDMSYRFVTDITPDQITVAQVLYYEPNEKMFCTVDLDKDECETIAGILGDIHPNSFRRNSNKNAVSNGPFLYIRLADNAAEIMFKQLLKGSDLFGATISSESIEATKGQYQINISALSEFISQKVITSQEEKCALW